MRIEIIKPDEVDESLKDLVPEIVGLRGKFLNLHGALAHSPKALKAFMVFSRYVRDDSGFDPQLRELVTLLVGHTHQNPYEIAHHEVAARKVGLSDEKIRAITFWHISPLFDQREKAALDYVAQALNNNYRVRQETINRLKEHFEDREIVDLSMLMGWYQLCSSLLLPLEVEVEDDYKQV